MEEDRCDIRDILVHWKNFRLKLVAEGVAVGIFSGLLVVLYRFLLEETGDISTKIYRGLVDKVWIVPVWLVVLGVVGCIIGWIVKKVPMASGSGIPQVEGILMRQLQMNWWKVILGKFAGGVLSIGAGLSLGREGPSVQIGAAVGQGFSRIFKRVRIEEKYLITSGASAGLAAAFNAPLAGVMFSLEEVHKHFSPMVLLSAMSASLTADFISKQFFGLKPVLNFKDLSSLPLNQYGHLVVLGILTGLCGVLFNRVLLGTQKLYSKQKWLPVHLRPVVPMLMAGIIGMLLPQVLGGGHGLIVSLVEENPAFGMLLLLLAVKFIFTMVSYGSGAPGGIFLPLLAIGALVGDMYGNVLVKAFNMDPMYLNNFIVLAMAGCFTAIVRAPITGSILITEMTGSFHHLLSVTIVCIVSYIIADAFRSKPIYEALLENMLKNKGTDEFAGDGRISVLLEAAVHMGSEMDGKCVREVGWPGNCLLVAIKRGGKEIIPCGDTKLSSGDFITVLTNEDEAPEVKMMLLHKSLEH